MRALLLVALGGATGSVLRYGVALAGARLVPAAFPWGTLTVNVAGSFAIGALLTAFESRGALPLEARLTLVTGLLGGFTTFSAFSWETLALARSGRIGAAIGYACGSVLLSLAAAWAGHLLLRR